MLFTNSKLNFTKIQGYNPLTCKNKHIHNKHPCLPVVFVREINGDGMGVVLRGSPANSGPIDFASEKSFPLNFVH